MEILVNDSTLVQWPAYVIPHALTWSFACVHEVSGAFRRSRAVPFLFARQGIYWLSLGNLIRVFGCAHFLPAFQGSTSWWVKKCLLRVEASVSWYGSGERNGVWDGGLGLGTNGLRGPPVKRLPNHFCWKSGLQKWVKVQVKIQLWCLLKALLVRPHCPAAFKVFNGTVFDLFDLTPP